MSVLQRVLLGFFTFFLAVFIVFNAVNFDYVDTPTAYSSFQEYQKTPSVIPPLSKVRLLLNNVSIHFNKVSLENVFKGEVIEVNTGIAVIDKLINGIEYILSPFVIPISAAWELVQIIIQGVLMFNNWSNYIYDWANPI